MNDSRVRERIDALQKTESDIAQYLYESGRCAVAHAFSDPLIDPDDLIHLRRLSADLDIARALAEHLIKHELHVPDYPLGANAN
ncbi:MAG: methylamine utilization protein MauJ [Sulfuricellaceae bacterium]